MDSENKIKIDNTTDAFIDNGNSKSHSATPGSLVAMNGDLKFDSGAAKAIEIDGDAEQDSSSVEALKIDGDSESDTDATQGLDNINRISKSESTSSKAIDSDTDSDAAEAFNNTKDDSKSEDSATQTDPTAESLPSPSSSPRSSSSSSENCFSLGIAKAEAIDQPQKSSLGASEPDQQQQLPPAQPPRVTFQIAGSPPPPQAMEQPSQDKEQPQQLQDSGYRIPSYVFARTKSNAPTEWSTASNESLFSLHMGNASFNRDQFFLPGKSGDLGGASNPFLDYNTKPSHSMQNSDNFDIGDFRAEAEARAAETMREVIRELSANDTPGSPKEPSAISRSTGESTKSFAFPVLANNGDKSASIKVGMAPAEQQKQQAGTAKADPAESPNDSQIVPQNRLFSIPCFSCCRPSCF